MFSFNKTIHCGSRLLPLRSASLMLLVLTVFMSIGNTAFAYDLNAGQYHTCAIDDYGVICWGAQDHDGYVYDFGQTIPPEGMVLVNPTAVAAGGFHTCAIDGSEVKCWGRPDEGQTTVPSLTNPTAISAGRFHTCALDDTGVHCWGRATEGQIAVPSLSNPTAIAAGGYHTCALDDSGVTCWGAQGASFDYGQLVPPDGMVLSNPTAIAAGAYHTCAIDGSWVKCWGDNIYQLEIPAYGSPFAISAGYFFNCALYDVGVSYCWGQGTEGQTTVPSLSNPSAIAAGGYHTCALDDNGVSCWGRNLEGQATVPDGLSFVPEPSQEMLSIVALGVLAGLARRKRAVHRNASRSAIPLGSA